MKNKKFEIPEALLVYFTDDDIITTSAQGLGNEDQGVDGDINWPLSQCISTIKDNKTLFKPS